MAPLSTKQRIEILIIYGYGDKKRTQREVCEIFNQLYPDGELQQSTVSKIHKNFIETGNVLDKPRSGRPRTATTEETSLNVLLSVHENPHISTTQIALNENVSRRSVSRMLKLEKFHPYKIQLVHELVDDDYDRRLEFCEDMMERCVSDNTFCSNIIFTDEATFTLHGSVNKQNMRYWSAENPHWMREQHTQWPEKVNVWAGLLGNNIIGPFFMENTLNGPRYLQLLQDRILPAILRVCEDQDINFNNLWYQQDGAPPHYHRDARHYLNEIFPNRWIGRRGSIEWPPRSPDLNPLDFFLWGYLKMKVYTNRPNDLNSLRARIEQEIFGIPDVMKRNATNAFYTRLGACQETLGGQFEQLR